MRAHVHAYTHTRLQRAQFEACSVPMESEKSSSRFQVHSELLEAYILPCCGGHLLTAYRSFVCPKINLEINQVTLQWPLKAFHESS